MDFKDYSIEKFLYELKTDLPSPGGGSTAALVSALSGALNSMVYSFTVDKKAFEKLDNNKKEKMIKLKTSCEFAVEFGNKNLTSDAIVAAILLHSSIESSIVNVFVNFNSLGNKEGYENIPSDCKEIIEASLIKKTEIVKAFGI